MVLSRRKLSESVWRRVVSDIENIVPVYARMNRVMSFGLDERVRSRGISSLGSCATCLDAGAGPGDSLLKASSMGVCGYIVALEPSALLASIAGQRCGLLCDVVVGVAEALPLRANAVSCSMAFFSARDFIDLEKGVEEIARVTRRAIVIGDIFLIRARLLRFLQLFWVCMVVPLIAMFVAGSRWKSYTSLCKTLKGWLTAEQLAESLKAKGLSVSVTAYAFGGLAIVKASKDTSSGDRSQWGSVRS